MARTLTHLSWKHPFLPQLVELLCAPCSGTPWDLRDLLILVPTQQAGRRLRESLALRAGEAGTGLLTPCIVTPDWLQQNSSTENVATLADVVAAWSAVLLDADMESLRALFPIDPPRRDATWALGLGWQMQQLQAEAQEYGLNFAGIAERTSTTNSEPERWAILALLETRVASHLTERGYSLPSTVSLQQASSCPVPNGISRILVAGVLDPTPLALQILERWSDAVHVEIIVHGNPEDDVHDSWGRADPSKLRNRPIILPKDSVELRVLKDPAELASHVTTLATAYKDDPQTLGLCLADQRLIPAVAMRLSAAGLSAHDPAGTHLSNTAAAKLVLSLSALALEDGLENLAVLLRNPFFEAFAVDLPVPTAAKSDGATSQMDPAPKRMHTTSLLGSFDRLLENHLPGSLAACRHFARKDGLGLLSASLDWIHGARERLLAEPFYQALSGITSVVLAGQRIAADDPESRLLSESAGKLQELLAILSQVESRYAVLPASTWPLLLRQSLDRIALYPRKPDDAWDLQGWLEIVFEDAPHLVIGGLNEGVVPEAVQGDLFMPESLRKSLGMRTNEDRLSRDRVLLEAALRSRQGKGRVDLLVPRISAQGDPLQPSRILFACEDHELVARAKYLFAPLPERKQPPKRTIAWKLGPPQGTRMEASQGPLLPPPRSLSPSAIRCYLDCPYRYYLEYGLRLKPLDPSKRDLDAMDFGNLCHKALELLVRDKSMQSISDEKLIAEHLTVSLQELAADKLGRLSSFALRIQLEAAAARLRAAAAVEALQRQAGWHTVDVEKPWSLNIQGHIFGGIIDRIDQHENGCWRVIDYKTSDAGTSPEDAHWATCPRDASTVFSASIFEHEGKMRRWKDLQLPLYLLALRDGLGVEARAGYFVLPRTKEDTSVQLWENLSLDRILHAQACAIAVSDAITSCRFWPPSPRAKWNEAITRLFPDGVESDVDGALLSMGKGASA